MKASATIVVVDPNLNGMSRLCDPLEAVAALPTAAALKERLRQFDDPAAVGVVIPCTQPALVASAHLLHAGRVAVFVDDKARMSGLQQSMLRAVFAVADAVMVLDGVAERQAVAWGADPERVVRLTELADTWFNRRPRKPLTRALPEMGVSLGLDAAEKTGVLALLELVSPYRGVNVVNYHRVLPRAECQRYNRPQMAIPEAVFAAQLADMGNKRGFISVENLSSDEAKDKVAVTFDDGYEDNLRVALPWLETHQAPACIYIATGYIGQPEALWWDRVGGALIAWWEGGRQPTLPRALHEVAALADAPELSDARQIVTDYCSLLNTKTEAQQTEAVEAAEALVPDRAPARTMLDWDEVHRMAEAGVRFGSHTKSHIPLDTLDAETAWDELSGAQTILEDKLPQGALSSTALPRGRLGPLEEADLRARFETVMTTEPGVHPTDDNGPYVNRRDGRMLTLGGRHHPGKLRLELTGLLDPLRRFVARRR